MVPGRRRRGTTAEAETLVKFRNPTNDQIQTRVTYIERVGDLTVGAGVFRD